MQADDLDRLNKLYEQGLHGCESFDTDEEEATGLVGLVLALYFSKGQCFNALNPDQRKIFTLTHGHTVGGTTIFWVIRSKLYKLWGHHRCAPQKATNYVYF